MLKNIIFVLALYTFNFTICDSPAISISEKRIDELANWFASGMQEAEKDYQKKHASQPSDNSLNSYTQTEAHMKLLVDIYNFEMQSAASGKPFFNRIFKDTVFWKNNPPPKVNTVIELRNNEDALINWVINIYKSQWDSLYDVTKRPLKNSLQNFLPFIKNLLKKERQNNLDYVFYHGHSLNLGLTFDLFKEIENFLFYSPAIFNSENISDLNPKESINRYLKTINPIYKNADEVVKAWKPDWTDHKPELSSLLLSTNLSFFGNYLNWGENTFVYFVNSVSILGAGHNTKWLDEIFNNWNFNPKYKKDLNELYTNFMKSNNGNLLQIFIPKHLVNKFVYIANPYGIPFDWNKNTALQKIINPTGNVDTLDVLDFYKNAKFPNNNQLYTIDQFQSRIVLTPDFFDLNNKIKIFKYTTSEVEGEFGPDYKKGLRIIIGKMIIDYIVKNQNTIKAGNDATLKKILYTIAQWAENVDINEKERIEKEKDELFKQDLEVKKAKNEEDIKLVKEQEKKDKIKKELIAKAMAEVIESEKKDALAYEAKKKKDAEALVEKKKKDDKEKQINDSYNKGYDFYSKNKYSQAIELFKYVNEHAKNYLKEYATLWLGVSYYNLKELELAEKYLTEALNYPNTKWLASLYLGYIKLDKAQLAKEKAYKEKAAADKIAADKAAKDKLAKLKAAQALQSKQFKNISDQLTKQANILWQFKNAQAAKKTAQVKKLAPQVNKIKKDLVKTPVNIKNAQGQTPLMLDPRRAFIVYGLDKNKARNTVNQKDAKGKTVLQYLIQSPYVANINLYKALITAGAKVTNNDIKAVQIKLKSKPRLKPIVAILQQGNKVNKVKSGAL